MDNERVGLMNIEEREHSYEHYKQWQINKHGYKYECFAYVVVTLFAIRYWREILLFIGILIAVRGLYVLYKHHKIQQRVSEVEDMARAAGAKDINVNPANRSVTFILPSEKTDDLMHNVETAMANKRCKTTFIIERSDEQKMTTKNQKTTNVGYINENNQKNNGRTNQRGIHFNQWFYNMECLNCGHTYFANGCDIKIRRCPSCQGGKP